MTVDTTRKVAKRLRSTLTSCYYSELKAIKRRLSFEGVAEILNELDILLYDELSNANGEKNVDLNYFIQRLDEVETLLINQHQSLFLDKLQTFQRKVRLFGFYFASIDIP